MSDQTTYRQAKRARRIDLKGRRVGVTLTAYERLVAARGKEGMANALIARSNLRWEMTYRNLDTLVPSTFPVLAPAPALARALRALGAKDEPPAIYVGEWPDQLRWALDSAIQAVRLLLLGQVIGAAAIARQQLERWTSNLAHTLEIERNPGESEADFFRRVWAEYPSSPVDPGRAYGDLSDLLHGRGSLSDVFEWTDVDVMRPPLPDQARNAIETIASTVQLFLRQVRGCVLTLAKDENRPSLVRMLDRWPEEAPIEGEFIYLAPTLWPLSYSKLEHPLVVGLPHLAEAAEEVGREALTDGDDENALRLAVIDVYVAHRVRAVSGVRLSLEDERRALGDVDEDSVTHLETYAVLLAEMSTLVSAWGVRTEVATALKSAANALRSAFFLWLEDDDRALICVRTLLESVTRLRVWRLKPDRAAKLTGKGQVASLRDWFEAAGWRRLSLLSRALGEMAHAKPGAHWWGARESLAELHAPDFSPEDDPLMRARGQTLKRAQYLLAAEVIELVGALSPAVGKTFEELILEGYEPVSGLEEWLDYAWSKKDFDFGEPTFVSAADIPEPGSSDDKS